MAICKGKYKNAGSTSDQLLFQNCCESTEYLNLYFKDLKDYLIRYNKFEELYNYCYNVLTNVQNNSPLSRITSLKVANLGVIINEKNVSYLVNKDILKYAYKILKRNKEGKNKKFATYFGDITNIERNILSRECEYLFRNLSHINIVKNTKEEKYINNLKNKIEKNKISIPQKANDSLSYVLILSDFNKCKREILDCLDNEFVNHNKLDSVYSSYVMLLKELKEKTVKFLQNGDYHLYCNFHDEIQEEHEINIRYESYLESFTSNKSEKKELKPINKQNTLKSEGEKKNKLMNVNSNVSSTCTENNNVDVFFPKCHNNNEISLKNNNNSNNSENKSLSKNLSSTFTTFAMSLNKKIFNDKSDQNEKHDNEKDNLDMLKINEQGKADDIDKTKKEKTEENEIENIDNEKKKDEQIENIKKQSSNKTVAFKMDKDDPNKNQPNDKTKNKDNGNKEGESFNKIQNEIINEFNSFLNEENDVMYFDKINGHKYLEFKNNVSDGNSALWENLIKKSNFYQIKEDFENYNKIMKQQEENEHDKGNEEKTLGDLLGMNKYESIKNKNIKDLKSTTLNTDDFCHIIKNFNINNMNGHVNLENYPLNINNKDNHFVADNLVQPTNTLNVFPDTNIKLDNKQEENGALNPLNKYFTMHDNIYYIQKAILKNNSVLYKDDNIEISLDQYYYDLNGLVKIFLKNKKIVNCYDVDIQISNKMLFPLKMKFLNFEKTLSMNSTNCYEIAVKCLHIYKGFPLIKVSYRMQDMFKKTIELRLPIPITKYMKKMEISKDVFNKFWSNNNFNEYKKEKIINKSDIVDNELIVMDSCLGGALGLCYVENMIYLCGCYTNSSAGHENYFVLVGIEMIKKKLRIVCKSNNPTLSSAILFLIVLMHKKHET
ncbi:hypothetical protein CYL21_4784 [Plasmodium falciparum NF54]|uniref:Clathrin adaptor domain-containing protein, putative n=3 Tax=Plasmodium falciparum TaxID=5833 RepID=Q8I4W9_PLAF7|nr:clathrin adaptor domain-containing protein, putative [Plasmodium falciparum 3D7]ETW47979.1 hypothetical protein PFMALIP_04014 [Plasmodium falciparum MaliPS096_E11]KAF4327293.1 hypothetical protein CYL21_4784 [Plasmodium falciparum NF54]PKC48595.1 hypothetical protein CK202_2038 [Plasmodium falciparum NF54]CZT99617.1 clathrin adaptor domain-containing protein, putative [Plasmodium falciparum 3D7]|eukprot:XP_001350848.1 conserved Plasmodium protein, unknown function [Plasmodium falciparum 3D7]